MAEREGFEPPIPFRVYRFSRPTVSTAHTPLRMSLINSLPVVVEDCPLVFDCLTYRPGITVDFTNGMTLQLLLSSMNSDTRFLSNFAADIGPSQTGNRGRINAHYQRGCFCLNISSPDAVMVHPYDERRI